MSIEKAISLEKMAIFIRNSQQELRKNNILIGGPAGIGKTILGERLEKKLGLTFIDHDEMKKMIQMIPLNPNPCSLGQFNLDCCIGKSLEIKGISDKFIFSVAGSSLFRPSIDNEERLLQLESVKKKYNLLVIVLFAEEKIHQQRYLKVGIRTEKCFRIIRKDWVDIEKPYWLKVADHLIDTSDLIL